jgi:subtilisin family serine protease
LNPQSSTLVTPSAYDIGHSPVIGKPMIARSRTASLLAVLVLAACAEPTIPTPPPVGYSGVAPFSNSIAGKTYILNATGAGLPSNLSASVSAAGGTLTASHDGAGVAIAESSDPNFASKARKISGIGDVGEDAVLEWTKPSVSGEQWTDETDAGSFAFGATETFRSVQWAPDAISAPAAWDAGYRGAGARVAIVDGGIRHSHIDIAPNLDAARSASFVPGTLYNQDVGTFWHGTHVAGIVAAPANNLGTVGIAPQSTIIGVKVLHNGSGAFSWIINGIVYAATPIAEGGAGAHIVNLSLGAGVIKGGPGIAHLLIALSRATKYARDRGALVVVAAGNSAHDMDHGDSTYIPAQSVGVTSVSATGPLGFGVGVTNFDRPASYTNFGQSGIELAGPGGDFVYAGGGTCSKPAIPAGFVSGACLLFDLVMAPCRGGGTSNVTYCFSAGTSMAAPAVSGVAALVVGKYGPMAPAQLEAILRQSADDLGKPGNDDFYGKGRVNAFRATQ